MAACDKRLTPGVQGESGRNTSPITCVTRSASGVRMRAMLSSSSRRGRRDGRCFFSTLEKQSTHGGIYCDLTELYQVVGPFVRLLNEQCRPEKNGFPSSSERHQEWYTDRGLKAAA